MIAKGCVRAVTIQSLSRQVISDGCLSCACLAHKFATVSSGSFKVSCHSITRPTGTNGNRSFFPIRLNPNWATMTSSPLIIALASLWPCLAIVIQRNASDCHVRTSQSQTKLASSDRHRLVSPLRMLALTRVKNATSKPILKTQKTL